MWLQIIEANKSTKKALCLPSKQNALQQTKTKTDAFSCILLAPIIAAPEEVSLKDLLIETKNKRQDNILLAFSRDRHDRHQWDNPGWPVDKI